MPTAVYTAAERLINKFINNLLLVCNLILHTCSRCWGSVWGRSLLDPWQESGRGQKGKPKLGINESLRARTCLGPVNIQSELIYLSRNHIPYFPSKTDRLKAANICPVASFAGLMKACWYVALSVKNWRESSRFTFYRFLCWFEHFWRIIVCWDQVQGPYFCCDLTIFWVHFRWSNWHFNYNLGQTECHFHCLALIMLRWVNLYHYREHRISLGDCCHVWVVFDAGVVEYMYCMRAMRAAVVVWLILSSKTSLAVSLQNLLYSKVMLEDCLQPCVFEKGNYALVWNNRTQIKDDLKINY